MAASRAPRFVATVGAVGVVGAAVAVAVMAGQAIRAMRRRLPSFAGHDISGHTGLSREPVVRVVALGDSTLTGPGLADKSQVWLHQAFAGMEPAPPVEVHSLAVGGSRVIDIAGLVDDAIDLRPGIVVIAVGANDAIRGTRIRAFTRTLHDVVETLAEAVPVIAVANVGDLGNIARITRPLGTALRTRARAISRAIDRVLADYDNVVLLDVTAADPAFRDRGLFSPDLFHPNETGHARWADAARPGLDHALHQLADNHHRPNPA